MINSWILSFLVLFLVFLLNWGKIPPLGGGFYCDDPSIRYQFQKDSFDTELLVPVCAIAPFLLIYFVEASRIIRSESEIWTRALSATWSRYGHYWLMGCVNLLVNEVIKTLVAEPRPHFIDTCKPDWDKIDCQANGGYVAFSYDICTTPDAPLNSIPRPISDIMRSFPSGHAQMSTFCAAFGILYLKRFYTFPSASTSLRLILQLILFTFAFLASITRVPDRRHHWWDVAVGCALGIVLAAWAMSHRFKELSRSSPSSPAAASARAKKVS